MKQLLLLFLFGIGSVALATGAFEEMGEEGKLGWPLPNGALREQKLTFGMHVTPDPENNPIDPPERFTGYHTALDLEIFPEEKEMDVAVLAACDGEILDATTIEGYGGILVQTCTLEGQVITVLYGHVDPTQFRKTKGSPVKRGDELALLAPDKSSASGFTRKHLHFGVHQGQDIALRGYVLEEEALATYIDPLPLLQSSSFFSFGEKGLYSKQNP